MDPIYLKLNSTDRWREGDQIYVLPSGRWANVPEMCWGLLVAKGRGRRPVKPHMRPKAKEAKS